MIERVTAFGDSDIITSHDRRLRRREEIAMNDSRVMERELPCDTDAERTVLGAIIGNGEMYADVGVALSPEDFSLEKHRRIFARMRDLHEHGEKIDRLTVANELRRQDQLEAVDGLSYLVSLDEGMPSLRNIDSWIRIIKNKSILRQTIFACQRIQDRALAGDNSQELLTEANAVLESIRDKGASKHETWSTPYDVVQEHGASFLAPARGIPAGLTTPWPKLTEMTSGWNSGDLIIVAGRTGMGKSVIGMQQAYTTARAGLGVAYISLEMSKESLTRRLIAGLSRVDSHKARSGFAAPDERRRMLEAANDLEKVPLFIEDSRAHTPAAVSAGLRRLRSRTSIKLLVIDHLQLMKLTGRSESRHQELSEICHSFKRLAGEIGCAVMLLSQLNRSCEQEKRRPMLSDLKETGSIEEDADVVVFVHRPEMYKRDDPSLRGQAELIVAKQRDGPMGKIPLVFRHGFQVFEEAGGDELE